MEDSITGLFLRLDTRQDAIDLLTLLCAEFLRQDGRRNECATSFAQSIASWSVHYVTPDQDAEEARLLTPVMALQLLKDRFEQVLLPPPPAATADTASMDAHLHDVAVHWTFLRALVLVLLMYDGRMRRLFLCSPNPVWPCPPPARAQLFLAQGGRFQYEVAGFLAVHPSTHSFADAYIMAYDFVMHADTLWCNTVYGSPPGLLSALPPSAGAHHV